MSSAGWWRRRAAPIIARVLERFPRSEWDGRECRRALADAYPFGPRAMHPYKMWLDEIRCQTGRRTFGARRPRADHPGQGRLPTGGAPDA
jgi:hypothetical protein